jgi:hypothetical protein
MNFLNSIWAMLQRAVAAIAAVFFYHLGKQSEQKKQADAENEALREEIDRLNSLPVTDTDRLKLWERKIQQAKDREKRQQ